MMQPPPYGSSYEQLLVRLRAQVRDQNIDEEILGLLRAALEKALKAQNVVLSGPEIERLSQIVTKEVLNKIMEQLDKGEDA